ncbi:hypothetical protein VNO80_06787 [Phaseolus coccineus]|uniref:Uncharacterized protein n=1 Tax=Phaseolus coccineus TaxID=3886 RepID=A0AAN9NI34_PHACN
MAKSTTIAALEEVVLIPPPHLSPFINYDEEEAYIPDYAKTIKHLQGASQKEILPLSDVAKEDLEDP